MKKISLICALIAAATIGVHTASAQTYYPNYTGACVSISGNLSQGSTGSSVLSLQQFLVAQNYPGGGTWMETGYFGAATAAAVRDFQVSQGLPQTGYVDVNTLSAIERTSCGSSSVVVPPPSYPPYTYPYQNYYGQVTITSLSQNTGAPGTSVTIYGVGFDQYDNTVNFGGTVLSNVPSQNGTSITFSVPYYTSQGTIDLYVSDSHGTSNSVTFTLGSSIVCNTYGSTSCGCNYSYSYGNNTNCCPPTTSSYYGSTCCYSGSSQYGCQNGTLSISYLNPSSGGVGTTVTVYGSGFSTSGNTVHFGTGIIADLQSSDGQAVSFVVPSTLVGYGSQPVTLGSYNVYVTNSYGQNSNSEPFQVTSLGESGAPVITSISGPTSLSVNQQGTWSVSVNNQNSTYLTTSVNWGDGSTNAPSSGQQNYSAGVQTITFTHAYAQSGTYTASFTVTNSSGQSNTSTITVTVSGSSVNGEPSISYLSPSSGAPGSVVTIYGTNFTQSNTINLGGDIISNVYSQNGTTLSFVVPSMSLTTYQVSVQNSNGTSNSVSFTVN